MDQKLSMENNYRVCTVVQQNLTYLSKFSSNISILFSSRNCSKQKNLFQENHTQDISHRHHRETATRTNTRLSQREI